MTEKQRCLTTVHTDIRTCLRRETLLQSCCAVPQRVLTPDKELKCDRQDIPLEKIRGTTNG